MKRHDPMKILATILTLFALVFFQFVASASDSSSRDEGTGHLLYAPLAELERRVHRGADLNIIDSHGISLISDVVIFRDTGTLNGWIDLGADINIENKDGSTPLFFAVLFERTDNVKLLLERGANLNHKDQRGNAPLHLAMMGIGAYHLEIAVILIEAGSDINALDGEGNSPLRLFRQRKEFHSWGEKDNELEKFLLRKGAVEVSTFSPEKNSKHSSNQANNSHQNSNNLAMAE